MANTRLEIAALFVGKYIERYGMSNVTNDGILKSLKMAEQLIEADGNWDRPCAEKGCGHALKHHVDGNCWGTGDPCQCWNYKPGAKPKLPMPSLGELV